MKIRPGSDFTFKRNKYSLWQPSLHNWHIKFSEVIWKEYKDNCLAEEKMNYGDWHVYLLK